MISTVNETRARHEAAKRLLLIDDSPDIGELMSVIVRSMGYVCEHAQTFAAFKDVLADDVVVVVVVDLMMPDVDGIEVLRYLGEQRCRAGIVLLSGVKPELLSVAGEMARALQLRVLGHVSKPLKSRELETVLRGEERAKMPGHLATPAMPIITETELRRALAEDQFVLHFQPQIDIASGAAVGVEALVRWQHPIHGLLMPDMFIGLCESSNTIDALTWRVVDKAFDGIGLFAAGGWHPTLSINVSAFSLRNLKLPDLLASRAKAAGLAPARVIVEITESGVIDNTAAVLDILVRQRLSGMNLSIDDFGTGFAMMRQLKRVPATELKIDKEFIHAMRHDHAAEVIVRKTIEIGHELDMKVVAEGVETREQLGLLCDLKCDLAQGYWFTRPLPVHVLLRWYDARLSSPAHLKHADLAIEK
jgi:EAL domain-containing protein (putative c-di-GMP-specific phosphodiesterase class I)/ActR/RegA family two-component response regulator